ncbi:hypothetical protein B0H66DRAFT_627644 [Apodospora peruviana]|uniref:Aba 3 protein n=1 Tax=Apodospora peruviana TaxID=516989 RepID=A0AAE0HYD5_9PEZI|nr:hypothetical protein B0H66DRAFT_627644 [Apodospora peruviana]
MNGNGVGGHVRSSRVDTWIYPKEVENDLQGIPGLSEDAIRETLAASWEYTRCVIPAYTNWDRYLAFYRVIIIGIVAEFNGSLINVSSSDHILGYDMGELYDTLFGELPGSARDEMARDYRTFLLTTAEKTSNRRDSELFRRFVNALAVSPKTWFRIRDADALSRFTLVAALTCNDFTTIWFSEDQFQILAEIAGTLYDAVAFFKHRAEGETNNTYAYVDPSLREDAYRRAREVLWALDVAWARSRGHLHAINFIRLVGGPVHMMMRRYRFIEDGLVIGKPETDDVVDLARDHYKLWNRVDSLGSYLDAIRQKDRLLYDGLADLLQEAGAGKERCGECRYKMSYGAERSGQFGGVELCEECRKGWGVYIASLPQRAAEAFPEIRGTQLRL